MLSVGVSHIDPCQGACRKFQSVTIHLKRSLAEYGVGMPPDQSATHDTACSEALRTHPPRRRTPVRTEPFRAVQRGQRYAFEHNKHARLPCRSEPGRPGARGARLCERPPLRHRGSRCVCRVFILKVCVECLFLRHRGSAPYGASQRAPKGRPTRTPPRSPRPSLRIPPSRCPGGRLYRALLPGPGLPGPGLPGPLDFGVFSFLHPR